MEILQLVRLIISFDIPNPSGGFGVQRSCLEEGREGKGLSVLIYKGSATLDRGALDRATCVSVKRDIEC